MADMTTHSIFSMDVLDKLTNKDYIKNNLSYYKLGSQGPDPFFYLSSKDEHYNIGSIMHENKTGEFFINLLTFIKMNKTDELLSFYFGMINHFSLDSSIHPYVFYTTGVFDKYNEDTFKYQGAHLLLERTIDNIFIKNKLHKNYRLFNHYNYTLLNIKHDTNIIDALNYTLKETYNIDNYGVKYFQAVKKMQNVFRYIALDRTGIKRQLLKLYDNRYNKNKSLLYQNLSYHTIIDPNIDYLNQGNNTWYHPATNEPSNESFLELYDKGVESAVNLIKISDDYLNDKIEKSDLYNHFKNISYSSGLENNIEHNFKFFGDLFYY